MNGCVNYMNVVLYTYFRIAWNTLRDYCSTRKQPIM